MYASTNSFAEFHQARMEALIEFVHANLAAFERLSALNFNVARSALDTANSAFDTVAEFGIRSSERAQAKFAAANSNVADAETKFGKANSKTSTSSKGRKRSSHATTRAKRSTA